jgi:hypothetical protein
MPMRILNVTGILCALLLFVSCHHKPTMTGGGGEGGDDRFECKDVDSTYQAVKKKQNANGVCEVSWDLSAQNINGVAGHSDPEIGVTVYRHNGHADDQVIFDHPNKDFRYCVRPNPGGSDNPPANPEPDENCNLSTSQLQTEQGCDLSPFVGSGPVGHAKHHLPKLKPQQSSVCHYKLTFFFKDGSPPIDPHIVVGTKGN